MQKPFKPNKRQRDKVMLLVGSGMAEAQIASVLNVSRVTLRQHFAEELANGRALKKCENLERIEAAAKAGNVTAMKALDVILAGKDLAPAGGNVSKKKQGEEAAKNAGGEHSEWGDYLRPPGNEVN